MIATIRSSWPWTALSIATKRQASQRSATFITGVLYLIIAGTMTTLWRAAAEANGGSIGGYTTDELIWYIAFAEAVTVCLSSRLIEQIGEAITDGTVAVEMLRPASSLGVRVWSAVGTCLPRLAICVPSAFVLATATAGPPEVPALLLALPAALLAVTCNLVLQHGVASMAFWTRDTRAATLLYQKIVFLLGGMLIPVQVLPTVLQKVCFALPFITMAYVPARLASGHFEPWLLGVQLVWLGVLWGFAVVAYSAGERRLQVVGG